MMRLTHGQTFVGCDHFDTEVHDQNDINPKTGKPFAYAVNPCHQPAVMMVLSASDDEQISNYAAWAACATHAPETAHEAAASMSADEYVVVSLGVAS